MDKDLILYRIAETQNQVQILRQTIDRRFPPDEVIEIAICRIESELKLLLRVVEQTK